MRLLPTLRWQTTLPDGFSVPFTVSRFWAITSIAESHELRFRVWAKEGTIHAERVFATATPGWRPPPHSHDHLTLPDL